MRLSIDLPLLIFSSNIACSALFGILNKLITNLIIVFIIEFLIVFISSLYLFLRKLYYFQKTFLWIFSISVIGGTCPFPSPQECMPIYMAVIPYTVKTTLRPT